MEKNFIKNEDCLEGLKNLPDESVDLVVTDCPYKISSGGSTAGKEGMPSGMLSKNIEYEINENGRRVRKGTKHINLGGILDDSVRDVMAGKIFTHNNIDFEEWLPDVYRVLKPSTHCYIMINSRNLRELQEKAEAVGFKFQNLLAWVKNTATPNKYYMQKMEFILMLRKGAAKNINDMGCTNLLSYKNFMGNKQHPTEKPVQLMEVMIGNSSQPGDLVLDPFAGSGSTLIAAKNLGRDYIGYEIDPKYYEVAVKRLDQTNVQQKLFTV